MTEVKFKTFREIEKVLSELENRDERDVKFDTISVRIRRDDLIGNVMAFYAYYKPEGYWGGDTVRVEVTEEHGVKFKTSGTEHDFGKYAIFQHIDILGHAKLFAKSAEKVICNEYLEREFG